MNQLVLWWDETEPGHEALKTWRQVIGGMWRLDALRDEFLSISRSRNIDRGLRRLRFSIESYLARTYEMQERVHGFVSARTVAPRRRARKEEARETALAQLAERSPAVAHRLGKLLQLLERSRKPRNTLTHEHYFSIRIRVGNDLLDPGDALRSLAARPARRAQLEANLRLDVQRMAAEYARECGALYDAAQALLEVAQLG